MIDELQQKKTLWAIVPLFLVLFIDSMGLGLLFPILNAILVDPNTPFLTQALTINERQTLYGLTVGVFMICWFFGAAILGDLSDTVGRRKSLLICLCGAFLGYLISAIAVILHSLLLLMFGRIIAGFTAGSQPIAQAAIIDISSEENKPRNIGLILLAISLGFVFGPIIGGILSDKNLVRWFDFSTPLYFASIISLLNALLLWVFFKETFTQTGPIKIKFHHAINIFISAFRHEKIWDLSIAFFVMLIGWSSFFVFIPLYLYEVLHFSVLQNSLFLSVLSLGFAVGCAFLVDLFARYFLLKRIVIVSLLMTAFFLVLLLLFIHYKIIWLFIFIIGIALALAYSTIIVIFSHQVSQNEQGWVMGVTGAILALCFGITSFFVGFIANLNIVLPLVISSICLAASGIILYFFDVR